MTLKVPLTRGTVTHQVELFYAGSNDNFVQVIGFLSPRKKNREFIFIIRFGTKSNDKQQSIYTH